MERITTIKSLLNSDFIPLPPHSIRDFEKTDNVQQLRQLLQKNMPDHQWNIVRNEILEQISLLLDIPLHPILVKSWHNHLAVKREVEQQYANPDNHEESIVVLDAHEIRSTHSPTLATHVGQGESIDLRFFIGVVLQLKNISLKIQQGEITAVLAGVMSGCGFMQYQNATLLEKDFNDFKLAGAISYTLNKPNTTEDIVQPIRNDVINNTLGQDPPIVNNKVDIIPYREPQQIKSYSSDMSTDITTENRHAQKKLSTPTTFKTSVMQFMLGVLIAVMALFVFWQSVKS